MIDFIAYGPIARPLSLYDIATTPDSRIPELFQTQYDDDSLIKSADAAWDDWYSGYRRGVRTPDDVGRIRSWLAAEVDRSRDKRSADRRYTAAVDLDGTLAETIRPHDPDRIGELRPGARETLQKLREKGVRISIWTVRDNEKLVRDWLERYDVPFDHINDSPDHPEGGSRKLMADIYIDDRGFDASGDWADMAPALLSRIDREMRDANSH